MAWRKKIAFLFFAWLTMHNVYAGKDTTVFIPKKNVVFLELGGKGVLWSANYERTLFRKQSFSFNGHIGVGSYSAYTSTYIPVPVSFIVQKRLSTTHWFLEASLGGIAMPAANPTPRADIDAFRSHPRDYGRPIILPFDVWGEGSLGIRYQKKWVFKILYTPMYIRSMNDLKSYYYSNWGGISIGKAF